MKIKIATKFKKPAKMLLGALGIAAVATLAPMGTQSVVAALPADSAITSVVQVLDPAPVASADTDRKPSPLLIERCGGEDNIKGSACHNHATANSGPIAFGKPGVVNTRQGDVRSSDKGVPLGTTKGGGLNSPGIFAKPVWEQEPMGDGNTSAGGIKHADSQFHR